jgi:regulatory protein
VRITRIETQKKARGRVNVYADGEFLIGLGAETLFRAGLRVGDEVSSALVDRLTDQESFLAAKTAALRLLSIRPRSEREILDRLREKEFDEQSIAGVIGELRQSGLVNDHAFACAYIRNALTLRPLGEIPLRQKLLLLGVPRETVDEAIRLTLTESDLLAGALQSARSYLRRLQRTPGNGDTPKFRQKIRTYLARRGYTWSTIAAVLTSLDVPQGEHTDDQ